MTKATKTTAKILMLLTVLMLVASTLASCTSVKMSIEFMVDGELYHTVKTSGYEAVTLPDDPVKEGDSFDGWYWDKDTWLNPFTVNSLLNEKITSNMKVYAKWESDIPTAEIIPVTAVTLTKSSLSMEKGDAFRLNAIISPENASNKNLSWTSSDTSVATVSTDGIVNALKEGTATISVKTEDGGFTKTCTVTVASNGGGGETEEDKKVSSVSLSETSLTLSKGNTAQLSATVLPQNAENKTVIWKSSNESVVTVSQNGYVTAVNNGTATITATTEEGAKTATCTVTVKDVLVAVKSNECYQLDRNSASYGVGVFQDSSYYYNIYYIGRVNRVPVVPKNGASIGSVIEYRGGEFWRNYSITKIDQRAVEDTLSMTFSNTTTIGVEQSIEAGATLGPFGAKTVLKGYLENSWQTSVTRTTTVYTNEINSFTEETKQNFEGAEHGWYRYTLFTAVDEFVVVRKSKTTDSTDVSAYSMIAGTPFYSWEYSSSASFDYTIPKFNYSESNFPEFQKGGTELVQDGTADNPKLAYTADELHKHLLGNYQYIQIMKDIDMTGYTWTPIPYYSGNLNGNGKTISNLKIEALDNGSHGGLFGSLGGTVTNITFESPAVSGTSFNKNAYGGVVAGALVDNGTISNCTVRNASINISATEHEQGTGCRYAVVGGIVGQLYSGKVTNCVVSGGKIYGYALKHDTFDQSGLDEAAVVFIGGITGEFCYGELTNCSATENLTIEAALKSRVSVYLNSMAGTHARLHMGGIIGTLNTNGAVESGNHTSSVTFKLPNPDTIPHNDNAATPWLRKYDCQVPAAGENQNVGYPRNK